MWDSGLLTMTNTSIDSRSPNFTYAGNELLLDGSTYYWRVRFADNYGGIGDWSDLPPTNPPQPTNTPQPTPEPDDCLDYIHPDPNICRTYNNSQCNNVTVCGSTSVADPCNQASFGGDWCDDPCTTPGIETCEEVGLIRCQCSSAGWWVIGSGGSCAEICRCAGAECTDCDPYANFAMADDSTIERPTSCLIKRDIDNNQLLVKWEISGSDPDKFIIQRNVNGAGFTDFDTNVTASLREYLDDSTSMGNSYQYRIAMVEGADTGDWCLTPLLNLEEGDLEFTGVDVEGGLDLR
jgi:hypothetical protein